MYYAKLSIAYASGSGRAVDSDDVFTTNPDGFTSRRPEYEIVGAKKYILRNLKRHPKNNEFNRQFAWCKMLLGQKDEAINIYRWLIKNRDNDPRNYVELSLSHLYMGDIGAAKKIILNAYMRFSDDPLVEDTFYDINEIIFSIKCFFLY